MFGSEAWVQIATQIINENESLGLLILVSNFTPHKMTMELGTPLKEDQNWGSQGIDYVGQDCSLFVLLCEEVYTVHIFFAISSQ